MSSKLLTLAAACAVAFATPTQVFAQATPGQHKDHDHKGHDHGGLLEVGDHAALLKIEHDEATGSLKVTVLKADGKTPFAIADAPRVNILSGGKRAQIITKGVTDKSSSVFVVTDAKLKGHVHGKLRIKIAGKSYQVDLPDDDH